MRQTRLLEIGGEAHGVYGDGHVFFISGNEQHSFTP